MIGASVELVLDVAAVWCTLAVATGGVAAVLGTGAKRLAAQAQRDQQ